jgi:hypothetical protein
VDHSFIVSDVALGDVLVSLGSAFIHMAVQALSYYLLAFLAPVLVAMMMAVKQRRERLELLQV